MNYSIDVKPMNRQMCHSLFREFMYDPAVFAEGQTMTNYTYTPDACDRYYNKQTSRDRIYLAILRNDQVIGEIILKDVDRQNLSCRLSIHLMNDSVKKRGYGTAAETLALKYAYETENLQTVYADALLKNTRSRHVLQKVGFREIGCDGTYGYYVWRAPTQLK